MLIAQGWEVPDPCRSPSLWSATKSRSPGVGMGTKGVHTHEIDVASPHGSRTHVLTEQWLGEVRSVRSGNIIRVRSALGFSGHGSGTPNTIPSPTSQCGRGHVHAAFSAWGKETPRIGDQLRSGFRVSMPDQWNEAYVNADQASRSQLHRTHAAKALSVPIDRIENHQA